MRTRAELIVNTLAVTVVAVVVTVLFVFCVGPAYFKQAECGLRGQQAVDGVCVDAKVGNTP